MITTCQFLGIYPSAIERCDEIAQELCKRYGIDSDTLWAQIEMQFRSRFNLKGMSFTDELNSIVFSTLDCELGKKGIRVADWGCNGGDLWFEVEDDDKRGKADVPVEGQAGREGLGAVPRRGDAAEGAHRRPGGREQEALEAD